ncbi:MAG: Trm112 family protein [Candidatus Korarchaeum sp.]
MRRRLLDLLACPSCLSFPLELIVEREEEEEGLPAVPERPICERWCAFIGSNPSNPHDCVKCMRLEIVTGKLGCKGCGSEFAIEAGVPRMLRAEDLSKVKI